MSTGTIQAAVRPCRTCGKLTDATKSTCTTCRDRAAARRRETRRAAGVTPSKGHGRVESPAGALTLNEAAQAVCRDVDPETFFTPPQDRGYHHSRKDEANRIETAKAVCAACPIRARCLEVALANREEYGIFGGLTADERRRKDSSPKRDDGRRVVRRRPMEHGTEYGYRRHRQDGEQPCEPCRIAQAEYQRTIRARRKERAA